MMRKAGDGRHLKLTALAFGEVVPLCSNPICWQMHATHQYIDALTAHSSTWWVLLCGL